MPGYDPPVMPGYDPLVMPGYDPASMASFPLPLSTCDFSLVTILPRSRSHLSPRGVFDAAVHGRTRPRPVMPGYDPASMFSFPVLDPALAFAGQGSTRMRRSGARGDNEADTE